MNKRIIITSVLVIIAMGIFFSGWYVYQQVNRHNSAQTVDQTFSQEELSKALAYDNSNNDGIDNSKTPVKSGDFIEIDFVHRGTGKASVYATDKGSILQFENFKVTDGPDLYVYLSKNNLASQSDELGEFINLGKLNSSEGEQSYILPDNYDEYDTVVIWCRAFGVLFSSATLN